MVNKTADNRNWQITAGDDFNIQITFPFDITGYAWEGKLLTAKGSEVGLFTMTPDTAPAVGSQTVTVILNSADTVTSAYAGEHDYRWRLKDAQSKWYTFVEGKFKISK